MYHCNISIRTGKSSNYPSYIVYQIVDYNIDTQTFLLQKITTHLKRRLFSNLTLKSNTPHNLDQSNDAFNFSL